MESESQLKMHSSDSEISKMADDPEVMFTLGDDTTLVNLDSKLVNPDSKLVNLDSKLVRISTNNGDEHTCSTCLDVNVKRICTEITDFCSKEIHEGFDVAKYLRRDSVSVIEDADHCINCESERDGDCQMECAKIITDVIVIPSAEAILDTGQKQDGDDIS